LVPRPLDKGIGPKKSNCDLAYMTSFWRETNWFKPKKKGLKESSWFGKPKCKLSKVVHFFAFLLFFIIFIYPCSNCVRMENKLWIENIVAIPSFFINFRIDMVGFKDLYRVVVRRSAFSTFASE
jgi:hypothetical protein